MPDLAAFRSLPDHSARSVEAAGVIETSTALTSISAGANSFGSWVELLASSSADAIAVLAVVYASKTWTQIEIGVGPAGLEVPVATSTASMNTNTYGEHPKFSIHLCFIPAGSRISARARANSSGTCYGAAYLVEI
jgi:hypothetical protein